ncbi:tyrosine-protein phosphatase [Leucobacter sp. M11]|uniref:tyrosine-protein phosphatase n=1 Tax=Leucobacter sp. M11 TaxID=2993565 RepID=UPI002D7F2DC5|nr:tyrosine-protein phosphatase [Leucobacter sp. M11]MEB4614046.1 tyrosine-protein phosphatase [Leucobacter sp. M11]
MNLTDRLIGTHNARELRDLTNAEGVRLRPGVLFRTDGLGELTEAGVAAIPELGIGTVVDLRTDAEQARSADRLPADGSVAFVSLPVLGGAMDEMVKQMMPGGLTEAPSPEQIAAIMAGVPTLEELYVAILGSSAPQFAELARAVIAGAGTERPGVLFHCTAGKDRTGLAAALLLSVAGMDRADIVADYTLTETNLRQGFAENLSALVTSLGVPLTPRLRTLTSEAPAHAIETALDWVAAEHGDAAGYLRSGGLDEAELLQLRAALLDG